jgi:hypothetical protein
MFVCMAAMRPAHGGHGSFSFRSPFVPFRSASEAKSQCFSLKQHTAEWLTGSGIGFASTDPGPELGFDKTT